MSSILSSVTYLLSLLSVSLQRKEAVALHVKLLDLNNEFLVGSHLPNRIARSAIPEHLHLQFASEGSFIQIGGFHADSPDDLVCTSFGLSEGHFSLLLSRWRLCCVTNQIKGQVDITEAFFCPHETINDLSKH